MDESNITNPVPTPPCPWARRTSKTSKRPHRQVPFQHSVPTSPISACSGTGISGATSRAQMSAAASHAAELRDGRRRNLEIAYIPAPVPRNSQASSATNPIAERSSATPYHNRTPTQDDPPPPGLPYIPDTWAVGGRHQQNYVRLDWVWNKRVTASIRKEVRREREKREKEEAEKKDEEKQGAEDLPVSSKPDARPLGKSGNPDIAMDVNDGVTAVDGAQEVVTTQGKKEEKEVGNGDKKEGTKKNKAAKETIFSKLKRMTGLLRGSGSGSGSLLT